MSVSVPARGASTRARAHAVQACVAALACCAAILALVFVSALAFARGPAPSRTTTTRVPSREDAREVRTTRGKSSLVQLGPELVGFSAANTEDADARVPVVYLHGVSGKPENGCPWMRATAGWLLCPRGDVRTANGTATWSGARTGAAITGALAAVGEPASPVIVGFSQGAYELASLLERRGVRARGVVLLGADVRPDAAALRAAGVVRVVLGGGEDDPTFPALRVAAARLAAAGVEARVVSLGRIGHMYIAHDPEILREAIRWAAGRDGPPRGTWSGLT